MVKVREARKAFRRFRTRCFWSYRPDLHIGQADVTWVAEQLMKHGDREAWRIGSGCASEMSVPIGALRRCAHPPAASTAIDYLTR